MSGEPIISTDDRLTAEAQIGREAPSIATQMAQVIAQAMDQSISRTELHKLVDEAYDYEMTKTYEAIYAETQQGGK